VASLGFGADGKRIRRKVSGKTKATVQDRLKKLHDELDSGVKASPDYTVRRAAEDWLKEGLDGRAAKTVKKNAPSLGVVHLPGLQQGSACLADQAEIASHLRAFTQLQA
jgi:hypothetical protein